jgi:hypothetical protein
MIGRYEWASLIAVASFFFGTPALAQVAIGDVVANGSGCPSGSFEVLSSGGTLALRFARYDLTTDGNTPIGVMSCSVAVALRVPDGVTASIRSVESIGLMNLDPGSQLVFDRTVFFTGQDPTRASSSFGAGFQTFRQRDDVAAVTVSGCASSDAIARMNTSLALSGPGRATVDVLLLRLAVGRC